MINVNRTKEGFCIRGTFVLKHGQYQRNYSGDKSYHGTEISNLWKREMNLKGRDLRYIHLGWTNGSESKSR